MNLSELSNIKLGSFSLGSLCSAGITLLICLLLIHLFVKLLRRTLGYTKMDDRVQKYLIKGLKFLLYLVTLLVVMDNLGIPVTSLVAVLSVGSLGLTLAAEDTLANVAGGLVLLSSHSFSIGDYVEAGSVAGTVDEITLNHIKLISADGLMILVPNNLFSTTQVTNCTTLGRRRVAQKVTASYDAPTETVKAACMAALENIPGVLSDPAPSARLTSYGASSIEYTVWCWCAPADYLEVLYTLGENLRVTFAAAGVEMTYDHLNVHIVENSGEKAPEA